MAITTLDGYIGAKKQQVQYAKTASITTVAGFGVRAFAQTGVPGVGTLAVGNTTTGIFPTNAIAGYPSISAITNTGYISKVEYFSSVACFMTIYDTLFSAGAFAHNAAITLNTQPSYVSRVPGSNYQNTELWLEAVTAFTGNQSIRITYLDQGGEAGDTGVIATGIAPILGRMYQMPLAAGDSGVSRVDTITSTVSSAGTFNVHVLRPLCSMVVASANFGGVLDLMQTGLPQIYATSAISVVNRPVSTASGSPMINIEVSDG